MKLLFFCQRVPFPLNKGERIRAYHQIRWLAERHQVRALALAESESEAAGAAELRRFCESVEVFSHRRGSANLRAAIAAATGGPLTPAFFRSGELTRRVRQIARESPPDAVVACSSSMAQYAKLLPTPRLLDLVDVDSAKWSLFADDASLPWSFIYRLESRRLRRYETELVGSFDRIAVTTGRELEKLRSFSQAENAFVLRQGIDVGAFAELEREEAATPTLVFTGQMDYLPNVTAVTHFGYKVFPKLRQRRPTLEFLIVGRQPSPAVEALASINGIKVTGEVDDVRPYLARAWVFVAPLRVTMGVPTKILEAMAASVPTVATEAGVRGLADGGLQPGRDLLVVGDGSEMIEATERLLEQHHLRERLGASGRRFVCRSYSWDQTAQRLEKALAEISRAKPTPRGAIGVPREAGIA